MAALEELQPVEVASDIDESGMRLLCIGRPRHKTAGLIEIIVHRAQVLRGYLPIPRFGELLAEAQAKLAAAVSANESLQPLDYCSRSCGTPQRARRVAT